MAYTPQPIPYQGSKRALAESILRFFPKKIDVLYEPFAGSAAITVAAASQRLASHYVIADILSPLALIWDSIINTPELLIGRYKEIWTAQLGNEREYYDFVREQFNNDKEPAKLLFLIARCVKNAVRFNAQGSFNQSPDKRRKGMRPNTMRERILYAHNILDGKAKALASDFRQTLKGANSCDLVYMDPPYQGTSTNKDSRYAQQLQLEELVLEMERLNSRGVPFILSYDGSCGDKSYGKPLPKDLGLKQVLVHVGRSTQATLLGRNDDTVESLYLSRALLSHVKDVPLKVHVNAKNTFDSGQFEII